MGVGGITRYLLARNCRFVLMFHGITRSMPKDLSLATPAGHTVVELETILRWLQSRFEFLSADEFVNSDRPGVLLTFDDGLANTVNNGLPVLEAFAAPAVFFVTTQHVEDPKNWLPYCRAKASSRWSAPKEVPQQVAGELFDGMSERQLRQCADHPLITIGSHSVSHPFLTQCSDEELDGELTRSRQYLEQVTGQDVSMFAYPTGDYDRRVLEAVDDAGYELSFAVDAKGVSEPRLEIPRVGIYRSSDLYLDLKLSGLHRRPQKGRPWLIHR